MILSKSLLNGANSNFKKGLKEILIPIIVTSGIIFGSTVSNAAEQVVETNDQHSLEGCYQPEEWQFRNAAIIGSITDAILTDMDRVSQKTTGKQLKVVVLGRAGTSSDGAQILKNDVAGHYLSFEDMMSRVINTQAESARTSPDYSLSVNKILEYDFVDPKSKREKGSNEKPQRDMDYSHIGFAVNSAKPGEEATWSMHHLLKPCDSKIPWKYGKGFGVGYYFVDRPHRYAAQIITMPYDVQERIVDIVNDPSKGGRFLTTNYRVAASYNPKDKDRRYHQNSTTWVLEVLAAAIAGGVDKVPNREAAIKYLLSTGYEPTRILLNRKQRAAIGAQWTVSALVPEFLKVESSAHPYAAQHGVIQGITALSAEEYMKKVFGNETQVIELEVPKALLVSGEKKK